jgi:RNA-binding protein
MALRRQRRPRGRRNARSGLGSARLGAQGALISEIPVSGEPKDPAPISSPAPNPQPVLDSSQRRYLRGLAHPLKPIVFIGEGGISPAVLKALDEALTSHELVKIRLRQPENKKEAAETLASASAAALCGVVGHTVVLYRPNPEEPRIELPRRG